ncbi:MAG: UDP-3-O-acyl-N-acetylglucosamine deacetylase [Myxococcota bacterium]|nr:UDP-3-O-acyl-N-acetylglucosamine deacetylase [Myxococcota bacterium]
MKYKQRTIRQKITCEGIGLHSGAPVRLELFPAPCDSGVTFVRTDVSPHCEIAATRANLVDTQLATTLGARAADGSMVTVATVEHLLSALMGLGVDNIVAHVDGPELPIMDGSAGPFVDVLSEVGIEEQSKNKRFALIRKEVEVREGDKLARLSPGAGMRITCSLDFDHPLIPNRPLTFDFTERSFRNELCAARTFGFLKDVEMLRANGLARGGSLENAIVIDDYRVMNPEGLRFADEFVRHKILDAIGDLSLLGFPIIGNLHLDRTGHALNAKLVEKVLSDPSAFEVVELGDAAEASSEIQVLDSRSLFEPVEGVAGF